MVLINDVGASTQDAGSDTRTRILEAAFRCLAAQGYASLNVRDIAKDAGVNHALISYYFGGKDRLVIAVLDEANRLLLERQQQLYEGPGGFADKWARARRFYKSDLASGFVRVQAELWAASLSNTDLREQFLPRIQAWKQLVLDGVREAMQAYGVDLPPVFSAEAIATLLSEFWLGMEFSQLIGSAGETARHDATLDAIEALLRTLDQRVATPSPKARTPSRKTPTRSKP